MKADTGFSLISCKILWITSNSPQKQQESMGSVQILKHRRPVIC